MKQKLLQTLYPIEKVDLRKVFPSEVNDFTPWLKKDGLEMLNETLVMDIEIEGTEVPVGKKSADMVGFDHISGRKVVIENQLNKFDYNHGMKAQTYAAGLDASIIIWIFEQIDEELRAALDWLNDISTEDFSFFGVEINALKVGENYTTDFKIRVKPNNWKKSVKTQMSKRISHGPQPMSIEFNGKKLDYSSSTDCYKDVIERTYKIKGAPFIKEVLRKSQPGEEWYGRSRPWFTTDPKCIGKPRWSTKLNGDDVYYDTNNNTDVKIKRMEQITNTFDIPLKVVSQG